MITVCVCDKYLLVFSVCARDQDFVTETKIKLVFTEQYYEGAGTLAAINL